MIGIRDWITGLALVALLAAAGWFYVSREHTAQAFATYRQQVAESNQKAEREARDREQGWQKQITRILRDEESKRKVLSDRLARADAAGIGLRNEIARLNARAAPADPRAAAFADEAGAARELLGACGREYRDMAAEADGLRDQVSGLQDYVKSIIRPVR